MRFLFSVIALQTLFLSICVGEVTDEKLLFGLTNYLNNLPDQAFYYSDGTLSNSQEIGVNIYRLLVGLKATDRNNVESVKQLDCLATVQDHGELGVGVFDNEFRCVEAAHRTASTTEVLHENSEDEAKLDLTTEVSEAPVKLDNEILLGNAVTSGEQFIAVPREEPGAPCIGCASHVNPKAAGVDELATLGVKQLDRHEPDVKHDLNTVIDIERQVQVVNGVRYILTMLINYDRCISKQSKPCLETKTCKVTVLEKPWVKLPDGSKYRAILANNCTEQWLFGDNGEIISDNQNNNKESNDIVINPENKNNDKVDDSLKPSPDYDKIAQTGSADEILKVVHNEDLSANPLPEKTLTDEQIKDLEEQIIPNHTDETSTIVYEIITQSEQIENKHFAKEDTFRYNTDQIKTSTETLQYISNKFNKDKKKVIDDLFNFPVQTTEITKLSSQLSEDKVKALKGFENFFDFADVHSVNDKDLSKSWQRSTVLANSTSNYLESESKSNINNYLNQRVKRQVVGGATEVDPNDEKHKKLAEESLQKFLVATGNTNPHNLVKVIKVTYQVVAGSLIRVDFTASPADDKTRVLTCHSEVWERSWLNSKEIKVDCDAGNARAKRHEIRGGIKEVDPNDPKYKQLAEESLQKFLMTSGNTQAHNLVKVTKVTYQVVAGSLTRIDFTASPANDNTRVLACHSEVWERPWLNSKEIKIECDSGNARIKRQGTLGGIAEADPNDPKHKQLAEESLQKFLVTSGNTQAHNVVKVTKVTYQVVAGSLTRIDFTASPADDNTRVLTCHSEVWERQWLNSKEIKVDCDSGNARVKRQGTPGGITEVDLNDPKHKQLAEESLQKFLVTSGNTQAHNVVKVTKVTYQVVAGSLTRIDFTASPADDNTRVLTCHSEVWERQWLNSKEIKVDCDSGNARVKRQGTPGGITEVDPNDPKHKQLAEESLQKFLVTSGNTQAHNVVKVTKVTYQVVAGSLTRIDFTASPADDNTRVLTCHSEVWERQWLNSKEIKVDCDSGNARVKRQGTPGGITEVDLNDPKHKQLAEESLQKFLVTSGNTQAHNVVKVTKVTYQVVAGSLTRIDFTASPADDNTRVLTCHSEVWERQWLNSKEIKVDCDSGNARVKRQGTPGGITEVDPNDPKHKQLAEESLQKFLVTSGNTQAHNVVKVTKVTYQVVAGSLTRIDFTASPADDNTRVLTCHSEVWERQWLNSKEIKVDCDSGNARVKRQGTPGGITEVDLNDPKHKQLAEESLQKFLVTSGNTQAHNVVKLTKVTYQVVAGSLTRIDFTASPADDNTRVLTCHSEVWERQWLNSKEIKVDCDSVNARVKRQGTLGGITEVDPNDPKHKQLAEESLQKFLVTSGNTQAHNVVKVTKVTYQVVAGSLTRIDFTASPADDNTRVLTCHSEVWERQWLNSKEIKVDCDSGNARVKRQGTPGGITEVDPNDPKHKQLAEESLQKFLVTSGNTQAHNVVKVTKVTYQVVAGSLTRIDFTASPADDNTRVLTCHSEVWERQWLNSKEIKVDCDSGNARVKRQGTPGGITEVDPNDPKHKQLAEESLQKFLVTSGNTQAHNVVKVTKVTYQVVAGSLTRIDFTASPADDNTRVLTCHSEVWERQWLNSKEIKVDCDSGNARVKRQGTPGGITEVDPNDPKHKQLAEESLQKFLVTSGNTQAHNVVKVTKVTYQVVAGSLTRIDFTASPANDNTRVLACHSEVWERPWLNSKEIKIECDSGNARIKRQGTLGGIAEADPNDPKHKQLAEESLQKFLVTSGNTQAHNVVKVTKVTYQVVAGSLTRIDFTASPADDNTRVLTCHSEVWERQWLNSKEIKVDCDSVNARVKRQGTPGGITEVDPNDPKHKQLAEESLQKFLVTSGNTQAHNVVKVTKVTYQVVAGSLTRIDFTASPADDNTRVLTCHSEVWERQWLNSKEIKVDCDSGNARVKRQGTPGGITEVDPNDPKHKQLAEESLQKFLVTSGNTQAHNVVKVTKVTYQVVAGSLTRIDFTASPADDNTRVLTCHSEVWERQWLKSKEIKVDCDTNKARVKRQGTLGGITEADPNDPNYKRLAEESLQKYLVTLGNTQPHNLLNVIKVTRQTVAGLLTRIDFKASPDNDKSRILICHSEVWERPSSKSAEITVDCGLDNHKKRDKRHIKPDDDYIDDDVKFYYADQAVRELNKASDTNNLLKLISIHSIQSSTQMNILTVRMYIETAYTYCLRNTNNPTLNECDEIEGLNHKLCFAKLRPSPDDELVVQHVYVVCDDHKDFLSVAGIEEGDLIQAAIKDLEKKPQFRFKLVSQGEPYVVPSLESTVPTKLSFFVAFTNCSKKLLKKANCYIDPMKTPKACQSHIWLAPNSKTVRKIISFCKENNQRFKRSTLSVSVNMTEVEVNKLVELAIEKLEMTSQHKYKQRILQVNSHSSKIAVGKVTTINFDVGYTSCLKHQWVDDIKKCNFLDNLPTRHCVATIWERLYKLNVGKDVDVDCYDVESTDDIEERSSKSAKQLTEEALRHIEAKYPHPRKQKVVRIFSLEKQRVAGLHYRMKIEVGFTNCTALSSEEDCVVVNDMGLNKFCRVNVWLRTWLDDHPPSYRVSCDYQEGTSSDIYYDLQAEYLFSQFMKKHKPLYENDPVETSKRFNIFKSNVRKMYDLNIHERGTAKYGVTKFADLTYEEFRSMYLGLKPDMRNPNLVPMRQADIPSGDVPPQFDWREYNAVTEVKNQGSCGSCWAFSVTGNIEGQWKLKTGQLISLSEQELVDCDKLDDGCNGGLPDNAYRAIEQIGGLETEDDYPYEGENDKCVFNKSMTRVTVSGAVNITSNETDMMKWLVHKGPISIGINANGMQFYMGGVSHPWKMLCDPKNLDHGVLIVGYGVKQYPLFHKTLPYWTIKNSWGTSWGEQGYYRVYRGDGTCGVNQMASSAIV